MKRTLVFLLSIALFMIDSSLANVLTTNEFYVKPGCVGDGTFNSPFGSIVEANYAIKKQRGNNTDINYTVNLLDGYYDMTDGLLIDDSCNNITYKGFKDNRIYFTNGTTIKGNAFCKVTDDALRTRFGESISNIVVADFDASTIKTKDPSSLILTYDDTSLTNARWPNDGFATIDNVVKSDPANECIFSIDNVRVKNWEGETNPYIFGYFLYTWYGERKPIGNIDPYQLSVTIKDRTQWGINEGKQFYVYNLASELDSPGEFYIDTTNNKLYFYPFESVSLGKYLSGNVKVAMHSNSMVTLIGAKNVTFENIVFENSLGLAIEFDNYCDGVKVNNCVFKNIANGINEAGFNNTISNCDFYNITSCPIRLRGGDRASLTNGNTILENSKFYSFNTTDRTNVGAVRLEGCGETVSHCEFVGGPHTVIALSGNENIVENNEFYDNMRDHAADAAPIYGGRDLSCQNNIIRHNYFHDIYPTMGCIYFDDDLSNNIVYENVAVNTSRLVFIHGGVLNKVNNNLIMNSANTASSVVLCAESSNNWSTSKKPIAMSGNSFLYHLFVEQPWQSEPWQRYSDTYKYIDNVPDKDVPPYECEFIGNTIINLPQREGVIQGIGAVGDSVVPYITITDNVLINDKNYLIQGKYKNIMDEAGLQKNDYRSEGDQLGSFNLILPLNKSTDVDAMEVEFDWTQCNNAIGYLFTLSTDSAFTNIISNKIVKEPHITIHNLNYHRYKYFWKVSAIGKSTNFEIGHTKVNSSQEYYSFTTKDKAQLNRVKFDDYLQNCTSLITQMIEGEEPGMYKSGSIELAKSIVERYTALGQKNEITQNDINSLYSSLKKEFELAYSRKNLELYDFERAFSSAQYWNIAPNQTIYDKDGMKYTSITSKYFGSIAKIEPHYTYSFKAQIQDLSSWVGFGLRAKSSPTMVAWAGNSQYLFIIKADTFELQKWNGDQVIYEYPNTIVKAGEWHKYDLSCDNQDDGSVIVTIKVDDNEITSFHDIDNPITSSGYFEVYGPAIGSSVSFKK